MPRELEPFAEALRQWLEADTGKPRKERRTARRYLELLQGLGT